MDEMNVPITLRRNDDIVFLSPWLKKSCPDFFDRFTSLLDNLLIEWQFLPSTNDIWCRDFMPLVLDDNRLLLYRYYPDYLLKKESDKYYITDGAKVCKEINLSFDKTDLVIDGGNMVKAGDYLIMTEKILFENPQMSASEVIEEMEKLTHLKLLLLPWDRVEKFGHSDGIVRCIDSHKVLMTNYADFDKSFADEFKRRLMEHFEVKVLEYNVPRLNSRSWSYINYLEVGNVIIVPALGIPEDRQALSQIKKVFPHKNVVQIRMEEVVKRGGVLNCITWTLERQSYIRNRYGSAILRK